MKFFRKELLYAIVIVIGNITVGWTLTLSSPALPLIKEEFPGLSNFELAAFPAAPSLAAIIGTYWGGFLLEKFTRKITLLTNALTGSFFWFLLLTMSNKYFWLTLVIRIFNGIVMGSCTTVGGCYIIEIAPPDQIGFYGVFNSIMISFGHCTFNLIGAAHNWRVNVYAAGGLLIVQFICGLFLPDSHVDIDRKRNKEIPNDIEEGEKFKKEHSLFQKCYIKPLLIGIALAVFQQFAGINALISNMSPLLSSGGLHFDSAYQAAITTFAEVIAGLTSTFVMDKIGRKMIWIISGSGAFVFLLIFSTNMITNWSSLLPVFTIFGFMLSFGCGFAPVPWIIVPEMFDDAVRGNAQSICVSANWLATCIVTFCFPYMERSMTTYGALYFFDACCLSAVIFGIFFIPANPQIYRQAEDPSLSSRHEEEDQNPEENRIQEL